MSQQRSVKITQLLLEWREGKQEALDQLMPIIYKELHRLAHNFMRGERAGSSLQTTALIHEAYLRLIDIKMSWQDRNHFYAVSARVMRRVLADYGRRRNAVKRGGGEPVLPLDEMDVPVQPIGYLVALDDALKDLETIDPRKSRIIELRYFGGLSVDETAQALELSPSTVDRELKMAKAWLHNEIRN